jgi:F-type H+-transporting ATPase subunit b
LRIADCGSSKQRLYLQCVNPQSRIDNPQSKEGYLEQLGINLGLLASQLVNFILLAVLLYLVLYKPVLRMLNERKERIARSMADVDAARDAAAKAQLEYDRKVAEAQRKAQEIIAAAAQTGEKAKADIVADAHREADRIKQDAIADAEQQKVRALADVQSQIAGLSMMATERVLGQAMDEKTQRQLISSFLADLGKAQP